MAGEVRRRNMYIQLRATLFLVMLFNWFLRYAGAAPGTHIALPGSQCGVLLFGGADPTLRVLQGFLVPTHTSMLSKRFIAFRSFLNVFLLHSVKRHD